MNAASQKLRERATFKSHFASRALRPRSKQIAMRSCAVKDDSTARDAVDQQPICVDVALGESGVLACKAVLSEGFG